MILNVEEAVKAWVDEVMRIYISCLYCYFDYHEFDVMYRMELI